MNSPSDKDCRSEIDRALPKQLVERISSHQALCAVVGLGVIGTETIRLIAERGFQAIGYDKNPDAVKRCASSLRDKFPALDLNGVDRLGDADIVFISVRLRFDCDGEVDLTPLDDVGRVLSEQHQRDQLLILQSTVPPGITRRFSNQCLIARNSHVFYVAHCPERLQLGNPVWRLDNIPRLIGGMSPDAGALAEQMIGELCDKPIRVASPEVSELSKLLENVFIATGVALVGDVTRLAHAHRANAADVTEAASSKPFGYLGFDPGTGVGGHCIPNDLRILRKAMDSLGIDSSLLDGVADALERMPGTVVEHIRQLNDGVLPENVLIVGVGFKIGSSDTTESPAAALIASFYKAGCTCLYADSGVSHLEVQGHTIPKVSVNDIGGLDIGACVIVSGDPSESVRDLCDNISPVLDAGGAKIMRDFATETRLHSL